MNKHNVRDVINALNNNGGHCYIVGGFVRDSILGTVSKDIDIEIFGLPIETVIEICSTFGIVDIVGVRFGVVKIHGIDADFSVPRIDSKNGIGHQGFNMQFDPEMTIEIAASRRDFTMNSMSIDTLTGQIIDPFDGVKDIENKILRHVSNSFTDDSVRVLRAMQFAGRFEMSLAAETALIAESMVDECKFIAARPMWFEWEKWSNRSVKPSMGLDVLVNCGWVNVWPQLSDMIGCNQDSVWHSEGDVWEHTKQVVDFAASICNRNGITGIIRTVIMFSALCHDMGKPATTVINDQDRITSPGHAESGVAIAKSFLQSIGTHEKIINMVCAIVANHMFHVGSVVSRRSVGRFITRIQPANVAMWAVVAEADNMDRGCPDIVREIVAIADMVDGVSGVPSAIVRGEHLVSLGFTPGITLGNVWRAAFAAQISGEFNNVSDGVSWVLAHFSNVSV